MSFLIAGCSNTDGKIMNGGDKSITVGAAASLKNALVEIQPLFENEKGISLAFSFASSGVLQKQIEEGAPIDLFLSAGKSQMEALEGENLVDEGKVKNILSNKLVLLVNDDYKDKIKSVSDIKDLDVNISIGDPAAVPAGGYAKESLESMNLWDRLRGKIVYCRDVTQAVTYVERGETAAGMVYLSDCNRVKDSSVCQVFDDSIHSPIIYPGGVVSGSKNKSYAQAFLDYLASPEASNIFKKYGFDIYEK